MNNGRNGTQDNSQRLDQVSGSLLNQRTSGYNADYSIIKLGHNTEMSPGDLLTYTSVKDHRLSFVYKIPKE